MIILYNKPNAGMLSIPVVKTKKNKTISAEKIAHVPVTNVTLVPGANKVTDVEWNAIRDIMKVKMYLAKGWLVLKGARKVVNKETKSETIRTEKDFKDMDVNTQEALIEECYQIPLLNEWKKEGPKDSVLAKINSRIETLNNPETDDDVMKIKR